MFTGIIESLGRVLEVEKDQENVHLKITSAISKELKVDQSIAHNGCCLTVIEKTDEWHKVTAVKETLSKTNLGEFKEGDLINLERCLKLGDRLDGHIVQGHVDQIAHCKAVTEVEGSWRFEFEFDSSPLLIQMGSITVNGVSLTIADKSDNGFMVSIIPYTFEHTNFKTMSAGDTVNIEFDVLGKYVEELVKNRRDKP